MMYWHLKALKKLLPTTFLKRLSLLINQGLSDNNSREKAIEALGSSEENWLLPFFERYTKKGLSPADETLELFKECDENPNKWLAKVLKTDSY